ncbi:nascent polypeptide-associated complex subunit alpha, muscle-specific form-like [Macrosteles quadrilineatus]|uniref:nascent polypeptide-associated complex subunit alpha, muscle-specific form-like n=1 Tax=Macrosteles quadrilineatus TaxID=74068 RepID=UPI0023E27E36|nr:nascent polypeptide-associated complex subunit alpha, muscle-specific form-like [Macrosteles quadrilineatus]
MGNSGSQAGTGGDTRRGWAHSYPRPAHKVLPERVPGQRLRLTHNGNILHSGGTLTGRKHVNHQVRPRSSSQGSHYEPTKVLYGSEPDLRFTGREYENHSPAKLRISRSRKKYKAPPAPQHSNGMDSSSPDSYQHWEMTGAEVVAPVRRLRLFKTKAESSKRRGETHHHPPPPPGPLQRSLSSPQFQIISPAELLEAAEKLRPVREPPVGKAADSPPLGHRARESYNKPTNKENKSNNPQRTPKDELLSRGRSQPIQRLRGDGGGERRGRGEGSPAQESTPEPPPSRRHNHDKNWPEITPTTKPTAPVKTFYFGMNEDELQNTSSGAGSEDNPEVDRFAASIQRRIPSNPTQPPPLVTHNTSGSDSLSSNDPVGEESSPQISLQLRPILPRKQLEIPRFSPTAAWRLLAALESPPPSDGGEGEGEDELIMPPTPRRGDKSGDSGISGDASPQHQDSTHYSPHIRAAWTPQQDLEETSSDGGLESAPLSPESLPLAKFSPRFSLSLPRDDRLAVYTQTDKTKEEDSFQSLKKLKRSMSGALALSRCGTKETGASSLPLDNNWVLSRSVPNSLNTSLQRWSSSSPSSPDQEEELSVVKQPSFSYLATGGHVMYLPEYSTPRSHRDRERTPAALSLSKSCEDLSQLTPGVLRAMEPKGRKKFTFQSTIRQIERRRLAEKLSKEAEQKERQRLNELEAMRRVEEEFQRKREREKADIRQQLRLYSLTQGRDAPEGKDAPPPPSTQVLSEYRQPRHDYRDFTPHRYQEEPVLEVPKKSTVHPQVVYQMPKSTQVYVAPHLHSNSGSGGMSTPRSSCSDNYRRDFAHGAVPHSLVSSDSEISQPNTRPTSRNIHRSRSASPGRKSPRVVSPMEITLHLKQLKILQQPASPVPCPVPDTVHPVPDGTTEAPPETPPPIIPQPPPPPMLSTLVPRLGLSSLAQPFAPKPKAFRPISFNPTSNKVAQTAM